MTYKEIMRFCYAYEDLDPIAQIRLSDILANKTTLPVFLPDGLNVGKDF